MALMNGGSKTATSRSAVSGVAAVLASFMLFAGDAAQASGTEAARTTSVSTAGAGGERLSGDRLRRFLAGKRIYLAVPLGGELPLFYRADGHVDGSGQAAGLGRFLAPSDSGRWWVDGEKVCQKWRSWYEGRTFCFTLDLLPGEKVAWHRDDGEKGVARFGT